jgi:cytidylate kinase
VNPLVITLDGPAAAGKSSTARAVARRLGCLYLDTGAMYRALALKVARLGTPPDDEAAVAAVARATTVEFVGAPEDPRVLLDGVEVGDEIRTPPISELSSRLAAQPAVRERLVELQRAIAARMPVVAEGRDMGTVVFPDATVKLYLDATVAERAARRHRELVGRGLELELYEVEEEIERRDRRDRERALAPLRAAEDAFVLDTTGMTLEEQVDAVLRMVEERAGRP